MQFEVHCSASHTNALSDGHKLPLRSVVVVVAVVVVDVVVVVVFVAVGGVTDPFCD